MKVPVPQLGRAPCRQRGHRRPTLALNRRAAQQRGPKREMSVEKIVDAAIEIADNEGLCC